MGSPDTAAPAPTPVGEPPAELQDWYERLSAAVHEELPGALELRHRLHADPRASGDESDTAAAVVEALDVGEGRTVAGTGRLCRPFCKAP